MPYSSGMADNAKLDNLRKSWKGKVIKDSRTGDFGIVAGVREDPPLPRKKDRFSVIASFKAEPTRRVIALYQTDDSEYLVPGDQLSRYRMSSIEEAKEALQKQASSD